MGFRNIYIRYPFMYIILRLRYVGCQNNFCNNTLVKEKEACRMSEFMYTTPRWRYVGCPNTCIQYSYL